MIERLPQTDVAADPADNFLLAMAEEANAEYLVTGDKAALLSLGQHGGTRVLSASQMVSTLKLR
jgi:predicted nucleic acid-binding protein